MQSLDSIINALSKNIYSFIISNETVQNRLPLKDRHNILTLPVFIYFMCMKFLKENSIITNNFF